MLYNINMLGTRPIGLIPISLIWGGFTSRKDIPVGDCDSQFLSYKSLDKLNKGQC